MKNRPLLPNVFFDTAFFSRLLVIAIPIMLQNFLNALVNILDTFMIGRLGETEIAAAGLGNQIFFLLNLLVFGIASSAGVFTAQFWGRKNLNGIKHTSGVCFVAAVCIAALFTAVCIYCPKTVIGLYSSDPAVILAGAAYLRITALSYIPFALSFSLMLMLRAIEQVRITVLVSFIAISCNGLFNFLLIFGYAGFPRLGISGAATATVIARFIELAVLFFIAKKKGYPVLSSLAEMFSFPLSFAVKYVMLAAPVFVNEFLWAFGITMQNKLFAGTDTAAYTAFTIMNTAAYLSNVVFIGLGNGAGVLTAKKIGQNDYQTAQKYAEQLAFSGILIAVAVAVLFLLPVSFVMPALFKVSLKTAQSMKGFFIILICMYPVKSFNMNMVVGVFRAGGDTKFCLFYDIFFMWVVSIPLGFFAAAHPSSTPFILYCILSAEELLKMPFGFIRLYTGKWLRSVID